MRQHLAQMLNWDSLTENRWNAMMSYGLLCDFSLIIMCMCKHCVPGPFSSPPRVGLGTKLQPFMSSPQLVLTGQYETPWFKTWLCMRHSLWSCYCSPTIHVLIYTFTCVYTCTYMWLLKIIPCSSSMHWMLHLVLMQDTCKILISTACYRDREWHTMSSCIEWPLQMMDILIQAIVSIVRRVSTLQRFWVYCHNTCTCRYSMLKSVHCAVILCLLLI